jgi:hypothetical protein
VKSRAARSATGWTAVDHRAGNSLIAINDPIRSEIHEVIGRDHQQKSSLSPDFVPVSAPDPMVSWRRRGKVHHRSDIPVAPPKPGGVVVHTHPAVHNR